jgi:hypothetical protein
MRYSLVASFIALLLAVKAFPQDKMVLDDPDGFMNERVDSLLGEKLSEVGIELTASLNYSQRCQYYFSDLRNMEGDLMAAVSDCHNTVLGEKNLGSNIFGLSDQEKALLLSLAFRDIIDHPGRYLERGTVEEKTVEAGTEIPETEGEQTKLYSGNEHDTRYFFAPSAFNLKQGELYYNTVYFFLHDLQYGVSNHVSMGIGTTVIGLPMYLTPKVSIPLGQKSAIAIGDLFLVGTWGTNGLGNLLYSVFSYGGNNGNISLGAGHLYTNDNDLTSKTSSAVFNLSAMGRTTPYIFFLTENYVMTVNSKQFASYYSDDGMGNYEYIEEDYTQRNTFLYGIAGIRIVSKNRNFIAWQVGLTYILNFPGEIPNKYINDPWETSARTETHLIAFPTVCFTVKFGKKF